MTEHTQLGGGQAPSGAVARIERLVDLGAHLLRRPRPARGVRDAPKRRHGLGEQLARRGGLAQPQRRPRRTRAAFDLVPRARVGDPGQQPQA